MTNNDIAGAIAKNYESYENYDLWQHCCLTSLINVE